MFDLKRPTPAAAGPAPVAIARLEDDSEFVKLQTALAALRDRSERTDKRRTAAINRIKRAALDRTAAERAAALVEGGSVSSSDPVAELAAADEEAAILNEGIALVLEQIEQVRSRLNYAENCKLIDQNSKLQVDLYLAAAKFRAAYDAILNLHESLRGAGLAARSDVLPSFESRAALVLGRPENWNGELNQRRRWLIDQGFISE